VIRLLDRLAVWWLWHRRGHSGSWVGRSISRPMVVDDLAE